MLTPPTSFFKFLKELDAFCDLLNNHRDNKKLHHEISLLYYLQKIELLKSLSDHLLKGDIKMKDVLAAEMKTVQTQYESDKLLAAGIMDQATNK